MRPAQLRIHAQYSLASDTFDLFLFDATNPQHRVSTWTQPLAKTEFVERANHEHAVPTMRFSREEAQLLMDQLWTAGLRPVGAKGSAGQLAAVQQHLEDMRSLAFSKSGIEKPTRLIERQ